jgi:hypothetical protein
MPARFKPKATSFSGQASVVHFTNLHSAPATVIIGDTGPLPSAGGHIEVSVLATNIAGLLELETAHASTRGAGSTARSEASVCSLIVTVQTPAHGQRVLGVEWLGVSAQAECSARGILLMGRTSISGLTLDGMAVHVTGQANQVVEFPGGKLIINYQATSRTATAGVITVAGIVVMFDNCLTGTIGMAHADIVCGTTPPAEDCSDRVTGGGFIFGTPSGDRGNFGVGGGIQNGRLWGHLNYIDHGTGMHVKAQEVTGYEVVDAVTRRISYDVTIDGEDGTAVVIVADKGEPGRDDTFVIQLRGYTAGGDLGGARPGGGNIQLHKPKCRTHKH